MFLNSKNRNLNYKFIIVLVILSVCVFGYFIYYNNSNKEYYLVLNGDSDIIIKQNTPYIEYGFIAKDNKGNDLQDQVIIEGEINTDIVGEYKITYKLNDITKERTVLVISNENQVTYLVLNGDKTMFLKIGEQYQEPGFIVIDNLENDLDKKVKIMGEVNTQVSGTYKINYSVTNKSGITLVEERTVIVMDSNIKVSYTPTEVTANDVAINISVYDNYFDYILLPDNTKAFNRDLVYTAAENGTYKFRVYSKDGSNKEQNIIINNIDKIPPTGSCSGYYKNNKTYISINAKDNLGIDKYIIDNQSFTSNQITLDKELEAVNIKIYDKASNQNVIKCSLKNENTIYQGFFGVKSYIPENDTTTSYWLYVPDKATDNMPMVIFIHGLGELGNDYVDKTTKAINWGPGRDIKKQNAKFPAIILMPQMKHEYSFWSEIDIKNIINLANQVANEYKVNKKRISIAGFSNGCSSVPYFLKHFPNYFSAAVPIECHSHSNMEYAKLYVDTPTWTFASAERTNEELTILVKNINTAGGNAKHSYYPNFGHTGLVGSNNYSIFMDDELKLFDWMINQERK